MDHDESRQHAPPAAGAHGAQDPPDLESQRQPHAEQLLASSDHTPASTYPMAQYPQDSTDQDSTTPEPMGSKTAATPAADDIPDGGFEAWVQVLGSWVVLVATWGLVNTFGVYQTYYQTQLLRGQSSSSISWIGSLQTCLLFLAGIASGPLYDLGYFKTLIRVGLFLIVFGMFMTSLCTTYWQVLLAHGLTVGLGMGLTFLPSAAILSQYFKKRLALVLGLSSTGSPIAGMIFPVIFSRLEGRIGFGWATRVIAFILLGLVIIPIVFMHPRVPRVRRSPIDKTAFRDVPFLVGCAACFCAFLTLYVPFFYIQLQSVTHGWADRDFAPYIVTILNAGSIVGRIVPNMLADKYGSVEVLAVCAFASGVLALGWLGVNSQAGVIVFAVLYGIFSGGVVSVIPAGLISLVPDMSRLGARMAIAFLLASIAVLIGTPIAGEIVGDFSDQDWRNVAGYTAAFLLLATVLFTVVAILRRRRQVRVKA